MTTEVAHLTSKQSRCVYLFLDEGGNLDFSPTGTEYFTCTAVMKERPFEAYKSLAELKYDLIEEGLVLEYFHAAEDRQAVRDRVFEIIAQHIAGVTVDSVIVCKRDIPAEMQADRIFYPNVLGTLLTLILSKGVSPERELVIVTDSIPIQKRRKVIEGAVKETLAEVLPHGTRYRLVHHNSKSNFDLQIADYFNWAIYRWCSRGDAHALARIQSVIRTRLIVEGWLLRTVVDRAYKK